VPIPQDGRSLCGGRGSVGGVPRSAIDDFVEVHAVEDGFRIGDVVKLTSGGRHMTVAAIRERGDGIEFECASAEEVQQRMGEEFFVTQLEVSVG
jgi:uncharacterized protein YodC (DUF2158 family)